MVSSVDPSALLFPESLFEQDYLVFLSFFGWMLVGLLAWTKPLCDRQNGERYWVWFGYFAFAEAMADFIRALSFSDPFFRTFSIETPLEMLGLGCLIELSLRRLNRYKGKRFPPMAAIACALLGFAIEVSSMLYSLIVAFMVSTVACLWFVSTLGRIAREQGCKELYVILAGVLTLIPAWVLHPDHLAFVRNETLVSFDFTVLEQEELVELEANRGDVELEESLSLGEKYPLEVLVVDDNPMVRGLITQYFESLGYSPDQFEDGKPASEKGAAYDLIVTDLRMPGMTGPEAATIIRRNSGLADQPWIIGVSATLAEDEIARAMRSGINDFIGKPFFAGDLEERIRRIPWLEQLAKSGNNVAEEEASAEEAFEETGPDPESSTAFAGHGMGVFSDEMIATALAEVHELCDKMESAEGRGDFDFVKETAHYLSNTAMAIGIESLYIDSKALQKAAEDRRDDCFALVESLKANFAAWETAR